MNYEDFSPEAKAGIEQWRKFAKTLPKEQIWRHERGSGTFAIRPDKYSKSSYDEGYVKLPHTFVSDLCIVHGATFDEAYKAACFARDKNFWLDQK